MKPHELKQLRALVRKEALKEAANLAKSWADIPCVETGVPIAVESASALILRLSNAILNLKTKPASEEQ